MVGRIPVVSGREMIKVLTKICYRLSNRRGSHVTLTPKCSSGQDRTCPLVIPLHRELKRGTMMTILARALLSREEFLNLLKM
jgi:predicted RNA binding protein YcfA (HicA-like mRNA interferase family)